MAAAALLRLATWAWKQAFSTTKDYYWESSNCRCQACLSKVIAHWTWTWERENITIDFLCTFMDHWKSHTHKVRRHRYPKSISWIFDRGNIGRKTMVENHKKVSNWNQFWCWEIVVKILILVSSKKSDFSSNAPYENRQKSVKIDKCFHEHHLTNF